MLISIVLYIQGQVRGDLFDIFNSHWLSEDADMKNTEINMPERDKNESVLSVVINQSQTSGTLCKYVVVFVKVCVCFPFTNILFKSVCKSDGRREGVECGITYAGVVNRAQPILALISVKWNPYWRKFLSGRLSGHSTQIKSSVPSLWLIFCFGGMLSVANQRAGWLSSSEYVSMFVWVVLCGLLPLL